MSVLIYDPTMEISVVDQSVIQAESDTPTLDTMLSAVYAGFTSKGKKNVILEHKSPASLMNTYGDDFASYAKYGQTNLAALGFARSMGRVFYCSLCPDDATRAYTVFGISVTEKTGIPVYKRSDTVISADNTAVLSYGKGSFVLDANGDKIPCQVKSSNADAEDELIDVTVTGAEISVTTRNLTAGVANFDSEGAPVNYTGEPMVTNNQDGSVTTFYPLFTLYYYSNGKGGNDFAFTIDRDTGRDKKMTDGRRYFLTFFKLLSSGSYTQLYDEPYYFSFNPKAKFSSEGEAMEGLSSVYINQDDTGEDLTLQMVTYDDNFATLVNALNPYKDDPTETVYDIDFINGIFKNGNKYTKIVLADDSIDTSNTMITLDNGSDGSIDVGTTVNGQLITAEIAAAKKEELLQKFFSCDIDDDIFDEKITDIDLLPDCNYSIAVKRIILGTFSTYRPDIALKMDLGFQSSTNDSINALNELTPYLNTEYAFMCSFNAHSGVLTDSQVGSPFPVTYTYDYARSMADNFLAANGSFQMHAGSTYGRVKYFRPSWIAKKDKAGSISKLEDAQLNFIEALNKSGVKMYGSESSQYPVDGSKLLSDRNALVIGRCMRVCHGVLPYYKYDPREIDDTLKAAKENCVTALQDAGIPSTIKVSVSMYQTKQDVKTENAHCDITFTFPNYAKKFTVTIMARRPSEEDA